MQPSIRRFVPVFLAAAVLSASSTLVSIAGAAEPALVKECVFYLGVDGLDSFNVVEENK